MTSLILQENVHNFFTKAFISWLFLSGYQFTWFFRLEIKGGGHEMALTIIKLVDPIRNFQCNDNRLIKKALKQAAP